MSEPTGEQIPQEGDGGTQTDPLPQPADLPAEPDWKAEAEARQAEAEKWKNLARKNETRAKANNAAVEQQRAALAELAKAYDIDLGDKPADPAVLAERLEQSKRDAASTAIELRVFKLATRLGANAEELLDSRSFCAAVDAIEIANGDFDAFDAAVTELVKQRVPVAPVAPTSGRTPVEALRPGALPNPPGPSIDDVIRDAQKAGDWRKVMNLQNQKLAALAAKQQQ